MVILSWEHCVSLSDSLSVRIRIESILLVLQSLTYSLSVGLFLLLPSLSISFVHSYPSIPFTWAYVYKHVHVFVCVRCGLLLLFLFLYVGSLFIVLHHLKCAIPFAFETGWIFFAFVSCICAVHALCSELTLHVVWATFLSRSRLFCLTVKHPNHNCIHRTTWTILENMRYCIALYLRNERIVCAHS